jgi:hypothetical protein
VGIEGRKAVKLGGVPSLAVVMTLGVFGCSQPKRQFAETSAAETSAAETSAAGTSGSSNQSSGDAAVPSSAEGNTGSTEDGTEGSTHPTTSGGSSNGAGNTSSNEGTDSSQEGGIHPCDSAEAVSCPAATECRTYYGDACDEAGNSACRHVDVAAKTPCADGAGQCDGKGQCIVPDRARLGDACEEGAECGSGHCVSGQDGKKLCCDTACDGACMACSKDGHCNVTPAQDAECGEITCPDNDVCATYPPSRAACASFGQCATTESYCQPEYTTQSCGDGLSCDGHGRCCPAPSRERVCTKECPCGTGEGVCSNDDQCLTGYVCTWDAMHKVGVEAQGCLPAHCVNDKQDEGEIAVDCGAGCGCRGIFEIVEITGLPEGTQFSQLAAMSGDGSAFAANIARSRATYPARVSANGVVTELEGYGKTGGAAGINRDGSIIVGSLLCANPPECTSTETRPFRWVNNQAPEVVAIYNGHAVAVSATGALVAGNQSTTAFRALVNNVNSTLIPGMASVIDMSSDGKYIAGQSGENTGVLWSEAAGGLVSFDPPEHWTSWRIDAMSDDGQVLVGSGYNSTNDEYFPFRWRNGQFSALPMLPMAKYNSFGGVSANGDVVVGSSGTNVAQYAFIWDRAIGDIVTVIDEAIFRGIELPVDLKLTNAEFISDDGRILVGTIPGATTPSFWRLTLLPVGEWLP